MRLRTLALTIAVTVLVAACSGTTPSARPTAGPTAAPAPSASDAPSAATTTIEVTLSDGLRIEPAAMTVPAGVPVTFVVTNSGAIDHEFYLGNEEAQAEHALEMAAMGGMTHDEPEGIGVKPGETKALIYTFSDPGRTLAACHVQGHYLAGMKADITVE